MKTETYKTCIFRPRMGLIDVYNADDELILAGFKAPRFARRFVDILDDMDYLPKPALADAPPA